MRRSTGSPPQDARAERQRQRQRQRQRRRAVRGSGSGWREKRSVRAEGLLFGCSKDRLSLGRHATEEKKPLPSMRNGRRDLGLKSHVEGDEIPRRSSGNREPNFGTREPLVLSWWRRYVLYSMYSKYQRQNDAPGSGRECGGFAGRLDDGWGCSLRNDRRRPSPSLLLFSPPR